MKCSERGSCNLKRLFVASSPSTTQTHRVRLDVVRTLWNWRLVVDFAHPMLSGWWTPMLLRLFGLWARTSGKRNILNGSIQRSNVEFMVDHSLARFAQRTIFKMAKIDETNGGLKFELRSATGSVTVFMSHLEDTPLVLSLILDKRREAVVMSEILLPIQWNCWRYTLQNSVCITKILRVKWMLLLMKWKGLNQSEIRSNNK